MLNPFTLYKWHGFDIVWHIAQAHAFQHQYDESEREQQQRKHTKLKCVFKKKLFFLTNFMF